MPPIQSKIKGKKLHSQTKEVINNVLTFMKTEAAEGITIGLEKVQERVKKATGVSRSSIQRISAEAKKIESGQIVSFETPDKKRTTKKRVLDIDEFDECVVRRTVYGFYITEKRVPTVDSLRRKLAELIGFTGGNTTLRALLRRLGFRWKKTRTNRCVLIEKPDIRQKRINYLRLIKKYRAEERNIVYVDESYILSSHVHQKSWCDDSNKGLLAPVSKGQRLIIIHAGGENGFVPNALLMWKANQASGDYHHQMNRDNYEKWVREKLIPNLPPNSVVVFDNAPYHNVSLNKAPTSNTPKEEMKKWLDKEEIPYSQDMLKPTLYELIKTAKPRKVKYSVDQIFENAGHIPLRLPPYSPDLNPIETVWSIVKGWVATHNTTFNLSDVQRLCIEKFNTMTKSDWVPLCNRVKKIEDEYMEREVPFDEVIDSIIINLGGVSDDESEDSSSSEEMYGIVAFENPDL